MRKLTLLFTTTAMLVYCSTQLRIGTDITNFMPDGGRAQLASLSRKLAHSELARTMTLSIGADDIDTAVAAATALERELTDHPEVAWVRTSLPQGVFEEAQDLYFPRRFYFASDDPERELAAQLTTSALEKRATQLVRELRQPTSSFFKPLTAKDPLGLFRRFLDDARRGQPAIPTHKGQIVSPDQRFALVLLGTVHSHFESDVQQSFLADLGEAIARIRASSAGDLVVEASGANRIAVRAEQSIKRDVYLIGACTFVGVALLFLLFFRSLNVFCWRSCQHSSAPLAP